MPLSDLDQALLELAKDRGALTEAGVQRVRDAVERAGGKDFDTTIADAVGPERLRELCRELPEFYARRRKARRTGHAPSSAPTAISSRNPPVVASEPPPAPVSHVAHVAPSRSDAHPGKLGRYVLELELGRGGLGVVYRAHRPGSSEPFAVKVLSVEGDPIAARRFVREIRALAKIEHPNVVRVYDCDQVGGKLYYAMELLEGAPLADMIDRGPVPPARLEQIARDTLSGLDAIHKAGILHRDLKPANILLAKSGRAVIIDFSIASLSDASMVLTQQGFAVGTPMYMAPEQVRGDPVGPPTDLYSLGITLWLAVEGRSPYGDDLATYEALADAKLGNPPPPVTRPGVPAGLAHLIMKLMATDPKDRFASAADALATLDSAPAPGQVTVEVELEQRTFGKYELVRTVGRGAHATVHLARDSKGQEVALKVLDRGAEADAFALLTRESRILARLSHPNVARLHEAGIVNGRPFLALEWIDGGTLEDLCRSSGPLPLDAVLGIGSQLASALAACNAERIAHRDLKPENVLVSRAGDVKLSDFGLARFENEADSQKVTFQGTPSYAAPEQCRGEAATHRSDLYALGGILFRMSAGRKPFEAETAAALAYKHLREQPPRLEELRPEAASLAPIVATLLDKDPEKRFASALDVVSALARAAKGGDPKKPWWRVW